MPLRNPLAPPPRPGGKYSPDHERRHQNHSNELATILDRLETLLAPYFATNIITADGQKLEVLARPLGADLVAGLTTDFALYDAGGGRLGIDNGTVASMLPSGMTPGATRGSPEAYEIAVTGSGFAYLVVTFGDDGNPNSVSIDTGTGVPDSDGTTGYRAIGDYHNVGGVISIGSGLAGIGSQMALACGDISYFWT